MASNPIEVQNVSKWFGDVHAVDGVSLSVGRGEMFGLIGHNGAGKSTLFKMMLGLIPASTGEIRVNGALIGGRDFREVRRRIGYLPENFVTYDNLSGLEVLHLFADLKKVPRRECEGVLERVGLKEAAKRRVRGYSKGMRQRLGFAQVLLGSPDLIFLDEPTNGLDPEGIHDFYQVLHDVKAQGCTIIITSHILAEIQERVDRLVILNSGRIAAQGTLPELRAQLVLPSVIQIQLRSGHETRVQAALQQLAGLELKIDQDCVRVSCLPGQKVAVLNILSALADTVHDIAIHEPSLEDLFLGYGGLHVKQR
ncbi:MAG TPA: ABC transporter ATP-binding protein [Noviherbaspirillum sp.]|uniref:ABC transporter ATP-binding protein n=1 Tax=Noviherbaspirillum sp. TaxID=1926288 RepID=UPI002B45D061|nr:ABC transporter ATP-binding protein [Noviherbaspirillum sp.]HJV85071.1 ABC transporter ATP-binding protein [Noviherbaspirillum sp.]